MIFGYSPDQSIGISKITGTTIGIFDWFEVSDEGTLSEGDDLAQHPGQFQLLDGRQIDPVIDELRSAENQ